jgi:F0F1-type ATP synthase assembly protein I
MKNKPRLKKRPNPFLIFIGLVFQMGATIFLSAKLGKYLDSIFNYEKLFTAIVTIFGVIISFYILIKQLKRINN